MGGGGTQPNFKGAKILPPEQLGQSTPRLFEPYQQNMPSEYFGNQPINDPTSILNAYMQNMPAFLAASRSENTYKPAPAPVVPTQQTGDFMRRMLPTVKA